MRWENLFTDFEQQFHHALAAEKQDVEREELRLAQASVPLREVIRRAELTCRIGTRWMTCQPEVIGRDWFAGEAVMSHLGGGELLGGLHDAGARQYVIIPLHQVAELSTPQELGWGSRGNEGSDVGNSDTNEIPAAMHTDLAARVGLNIVLRDIARRRRVVTLHVSGGGQVDTREYRGRLNVVGADWCSLRCEREHRDRIVALAHLAWISVEAA